jgi:hypothetical protein
MSNPFAPVDLRYLAAGQEQGHQNALRGFLQQNGGALMSGDAGAINELAAMDPRLAMQMQGQQDDRAFRREQVDYQRGRDARADSRADERLEMARTQFAQATEQHIATMDGLEVKQEAARLQPLMQQAATALQIGDLDAFNAATGQMDESTPLVNDIDDAHILFSGLDGAFEVMNTAQDLFGQEAPADEYGRYAQEERAAGREPLSRIDYAQAKKGNGTTVQSPDGTKIQVGGAAGSGAKLSEFQAKNNLYATRMRGALNILDSEMEGGGYLSDALTSLPNKAAENAPFGLDNIARNFQNPDYQKAQQAGMAWLMAFLRRDTGAAVTPSEEHMYGKAYLPQPGDGPALLDQKRLLREQAMAAVESGMDPLQILVRDEALLSAARATDQGGGVNAASALQAPATAENPFAGMSEGDFLQIDISTLTPEQLDQLFEARGL